MSLRKDFEQPVFSQGEEYTQVPEEELGGAYESIDQKNEIISRRQALRFLGTFGVITARAIVKVAIRDIFADHPVDQETPDEISDPPPEDFVLTFPAPPADEDYPALVHITADSVEVADTSNVCMHPLPPDYPYGQAQEQTVDVPSGQHTLWVPGAYNAPQCRVDQNREAMIALQGRERAVIMPVMTNGQPELEGGDKNSTLTAYPVHQNILFSRLQQINEGSVPAEGGFRSVVNSWVVSAEPMTPDDLYMTRDDITASSFKITQEEETLARGWFDLERAEMLRGEIRSGELRWTRLSPAAKYFSAPHPRFYQATIGALCRGQSIWAQVQKVAIMPEVIPPAAVKMTGYMYVEPAVDSAEHCGVPFALKKFWTDAPSVYAGLENIAELNEKTLRATQEWSAQIQRVSHPWEGPVYRPDPGDSWQDALGFAVVGTGGYAIVRLVIAGGGGGFGPRMIVELFE